jgi:predicted CopG family antitoxin
MPKYGLKNNYLNLKRNYGLGRLICLILQNRISMLKSISLYLYIQNMAKTKTVSNNVHEELKLKKADRSSSELLKSLIESSKPKKVSGLRSCFGILKKDKEWKEADKHLKIGWKGWNEKYV